MLQMDFNKLFEGVTETNFQDRILEIRDTLDIENKTFEDLKETIKTKDSQIAELRDTNHKLFLRISSPISEGASNEPEAPSMDDILNNINNMEVN